MWHLLRYIILLNHLCMLSNQPFKHYFNTTWRHLVKDRRFTLLNLLGLSTGLACALLIYLWVTDEWQMDKFHKNDARLYQVMENRIQGPNIWTAQSAPAPEADALANEMPEVEYAVSVVSAGKTAVTSTPEITIKSNGLYAGADFFHVFSYSLIQGNPAQVLGDKKGIVLSDLLAKRLFGTTENLIGKTVVLQHEQPYTISGIFTAPGVHSSQQFDFVLPFLSNYGVQDNRSNWDNTFCSTYLILKPGANVAQFNAKIAGLIVRKSNHQINYRTPFVQRYSDIYLYGRYEAGALAGGRIDYVRLFSLIALFILVIACINFMNLSTARAAGRAKEVGIRKVVGAGRATLIIQFLGESIGMAVVSCLLAIGWVSLFLPAFNNITGKQLSLVHLNTSFILSASGITLFTGLVAGSYPALYLSRFKPIQVLKGKLRTVAGEVLVRKGLVVFQFTLSIILIVAVGVVYRQITFIQTKPLGYDRDHVISIEKDGRLNDVQQQNTFLAEARRIPGVVRASSIDHSLTGHDGGTYAIVWPGKDPNDRTEFEIVAGDLDMISTLNMTIKNGRDFSAAYPSDSAGIIFNEAAIRFMRLKHPVGQQVTMWDRPVKIVGVVGDFHFQSLHENVKPLLILLRPGWTSRFVIKLAADKEKPAIAALDQLYRQFNPDWSFSYSFMDETYQALYVSENRVSVLSRWFAGLAILISCLGLFGLAAFTAQRRNKEIGIRKVLGASVSGVVMLLAGDFLKLILVAMLISFPLAWWATSQWLKSFAYRIDIGIGIFAAADVLIILLTFLTISFQSVRAALANPVKSLRTE
jgi:putative ABC transport system permease protein